MPRSKSAVPRYCLHRSSGQAVVYIDRKPRYLGVYGSPESKQAYAAVLDELANGIPATAVTEASIPVVSVNELLLAFATSELSRYSSGEAYCFRAAMKVLRQLYGETSVAEFGPLRFRTLREAMVSGDPHAKASSGKPQPRIPWSRATVNRQAKRIRQIFRWGVSWELVPVEVVQRLEAVRSLAIGETTAHDNAPRLAPPQADIDAARAHLKPLYRDVLDLQLLTGARPGELLRLTGAMIERRADCWIAELHQHKTARKGKRRFLIFTAPAQAIILRYAGSNPAALLFPARRDNYTAAVKRACRKANITPFCPHQLRHAVAAAVVDGIGIEHAQHLLGHSDAAMTLHYSRSAEKKAVEAAMRLGADNQPQQPE